MIAGKR